MVFKRVFFDRSAWIWMLISLFSILILPFIIGLVLWLKSSPLFIQQDIGSLITSTKWSPLHGEFGFGAFIASSFYVTLIAFIFSAPVSLLAAIYLTQFASNHFLSYMHSVLDILAGLPSVIFGVWGVLIVVPFIGEIVAPFFGISSSGYTTLAAGIVLAIMCIPYTLNMLIEVFKSVPIGLKEANLSLGATYWETIKMVIIRRSYPGIVSSFGLGISKAFGETMAVMMVVGNQIKISFNPFDASYPLPALIANNYGEMLSIPKYDAALMFAAFLLFGIILLINVFFRYLIHKTVRYE